MDELEFDWTASSVLVLDNDEIERTSLAGLFQNVGFAAVFHDALSNQTIESYFGEVAHEIHLLVLGLRGLPRMARRLVEHARGHYDGPILVLTDRIERMVEECLHAGAHACLLRDETNDELIMLKAEMALVERHYSDELENQSRRSQRMFVNILSVLARILESKDPYTKNHSHNVCKYSRMIGRRCGLSEDEIDRLGLAALLHDFGKIGIVEAILNKPEALTDEEFEIMKTHPTLGGALLESLPDVADIVPAIIHHHERWDGRGYPDELIGDEAHLWARIIGIADAYDTMASRRTYKEPRSQETCVEELRRCAGTQFDPKLVELFVQVLADVERRESANSRRGT